MKSKAFLLYIVLAVFFSSCEDVLDTAPKGELAEGVSNASVVDKYVIAAYQGLMQHFYYSHGESFTGPANNWVSDVRSDDSYKGGGGISDRIDLHQLETCAFDPSNYAIQQKWRNLMFAIARTNLAIREIISLDDPGYKKNEKMAEMKLLRGHFHFELQRIFKKIPYLDENADPSTTSNTEFSQEELYNKIEEDLQFAFDNLPAIQAEVGRMNKSIASAYLAKLYIETGQWTKVPEKADFVISGSYNLLLEPEDLWTIAFENGSESVFAIQYSTENFYANHDWGSLLNVTNSPGIDNGGYAAGDDFYHGSQNLLNAYRTDADGLPLFDSFNDVNVTDASYSGNLDPRLDFTVARIGVPWKGTAVYNNDWIRSVDYPGYSVKKQVVPPNEPGVNQTFPWAAAGLNYYIIRYADVLLWKAEALIESNQDLDNARNLINEVRERAMNSTYVKRLDGMADAANYNIGLYPSAGWNQDYARKAVRFERRLELALEGHRLFDLNRWGITSTVMNEYMTNEDWFYFEGLVFIDDKHEYLPIPQAEIDLSPGLYEQNNY